MYVALLESVVSSRCTHRNYSEHQTSRCTRGFDARHLVDFFVFAQRGTFVTTPDFAESTPGPTPRILHLDMPQHPLVQLLCRRGPGQEVHQVVQSRVLESQQNCTPLKKETITNQWGQGGRRKGHSGQTFWIIFLGQSSSVLGLRYVVYNGAWRKAVNSAGS